MNYNMMNPKADYVNFHSAVARNARFHEFSAMKIFYNAKPFTFLVNANTTNPGIA